MRHFLFLLLLVILFSCEKENNPLTIESYLTNKEVRKIKTNPSGNKVFFLSSIIDPNANPLMCSISYIYQLSCTDGDKTLYFDNLRYVSDFSIDEACNLYACMNRNLVKFSPPQDSVTIKTAALTFSSVASTADGKIWAGTYGDGLYYYDTHIWTRYSKQNSDLSGNNVSNVILDHDNRLWLTVEGDTGSIAYISGGNVTTYKWKDLTGENISYVSHFTVDRDGLAWVSYYHGNQLVLASVNIDGQYTTYSPSFLTSKNIIQLDTDFDGNLMMIVGSSVPVKLFTRVGVEWGELSIDILNSETYLYSATRDALGYLWLGTNNGIKKVLPTD